MASTITDITSTTSVAVEGTITITAIRSARGMTYGRVAKIAVRSRRAAVEVT